jgi:hypothetical protein
LAEKFEAPELVNILNKLFARFDDIAKVNLSALNQLITSFLFRKMIVCE